MFMDTSIVTQSKTSTPLSSNTVPSNTVPPTDSKYTVSKAVSEPITSKRKAEQSAHIELPMTYQTLRKYLPHDYPFILIDRVTECLPYNKIVGIKNVTINEPFFTGHFPNQPIMPGVLMIEAMAQLSGILGFVSDEQTLENGFIYLFAGVDKVRFKRQVIPGDQLIIKSCHVLNKRNVYKYQCCAYVDNKLAVSAELMLIKQLKTTLL